MFVAGAPAIFDNVRESVEVARSKGVPVIWVVREHHPSGKESTRGRKRERERERERERLKRSERERDCLKRCIRFQCSIVGDDLSTPTPLKKRPGVDAEVTRAHLYHGPDATGPSGTSGGGGGGAADPLPVPPLALLSEGSELAAGLSPLGGEHVVSKKRFSAFHATHLASLLRRMGCTHVVVAGVQTPNCVRATAFDALAEDFPAVSVLSDCTASATDAVQSANLFDLRNAGIHTPTLGQWKASLGGGGLFSALFGR